MGERQCVRELVLRRGNPSWKTREGFLAEGSLKMHQTWRHMCKERFLWRQKHPEQRHGDGEGALLCAERRGQDRATQLVESQPRACSS